MKIFENLRKKYCICDMPKGIFTRTGKCIFCDLFIDAEKLLSEKVEELEKWTFCPSYLDCIYPSHISKCPHSKNNWIIKIKQVKKILGVQDEN